MFGIIDFISKIATHFIGLFQQGGEVFAGWVSGIIPLLVVLMTGITAVIKLIGEERVNTAARWASKNIITRYTLLPILAVLFLTNATMIELYAMFLLVSLSIGITNNLPWFVLSSPA